jgi:hypothetical protein
VEYTVPGRDGDGKDELIALVTTIGDPAAAPAQAYHERWEHETGNDQIKTHLPARARPDPAVKELRTWSARKSTATLRREALCHIPG